MNELLSWQLWWDTSDAVVAVQPIDEGKTRENSTSDVTDGVEELMKNGGKSKEFRLTASSAITQHIALEETLTVLEAEVDQASADAENVTHTIEQEKAAVSLFQQLDTAFSSADPQNLLEKFRAQLQSQQEPKDNNDKEDAMINVPKSHLAEVKKKVFVHQQDHLKSHPDKTQAS